MAVTAGIPYHLGCGLLRAATCSSGSRVAGEAGRTQHVVSREGVLDWILEGTSQSSGTAHVCREILATHKPFLACRPTVQ